MSKETDVLSSSEFTKNSEENLQNLEEKKEILEESQLENLPGKETNLNKSASSLLSGLSLGSPSKFEDEELFSAFTDSRFFYPAADLLSRPLYNLGVTPNNVTWASMGLQLLSTITLIFGFHKVTSFLFLMANLLDNIDGRMARKYKMTSTLGQLMDFLSDVLLHGLFTMVLVLKYWSSFNLLSFLGLSCLIGGSLFHVCLLEAYQSLQMVGNENFFRSKMDELRTKTSDKDPNLKQVIKLYKQIFAELWAFYNFGLNLLALSINDPYHDQGLGRKEMLEYYLKKFSIFGSGNLVVFNSLMLFFNLWNYNLVQVFNSVPKVLLMTALTPLSWYLSKIYPSQSYLVGWVNKWFWLGFSFVTICYAQVNLVWGLGWLLFSYNLSSSG